MEKFFDRIDLHCGDCLAVLATLPDNSVDSCVTDPPYHLTSIVKRMGAPNAARVGYGSDGRYQRVSGGFMGKQWDGGDVAFRVETWTAVCRVLKPGGYLLAFGGTRTYHRMACAIEDAGFEVRDMVSFLYGCGFPKSHDVSKGIDRAAGAEREVVGVNSYAAKRTGHGKEGVLETRGPGLGGIESAHITAPATDAARKWAGWGTSLKPALEPICMARKPLGERTVAANVLAHGTGAINVDGCRIAGEVPAFEYFETGSKRGYEGGIKGGARTGEKRNGRWPANVIHDGSEEVTAAFPETHAAGTCSQRDDRGPFSAGTTPLQSRAIPNDSGSAARFFYSAKADADDRLGSRHPTVKPVDLMQYLVRLVTPKGGLVLDPFAGTGTTGEAAWREGMRAVLIEAEADYQADIRRRMALVLAGPDERARESMKAKFANKPRDDGPLFNREFPVAGTSPPADDYDAIADVEGSIDEAYRVIRERKAAGGPGWPKEPDK